MYLKVYLYTKLTLITTENKFNNKFNNNSNKRKLQNAISLINLFFVP